MKGSLTRINWLLVLVYLFLAGGLSAMTVYLTAGALLDTALALTLLFGLLGMIAYAFYVRDEGRGWRFVAALNWLGTLSALTVYLIVAGWLDTALAVAILCFLAAGVLLYVRFLRTDAARGEPSPAERDVPPAR